MSNNTYNHKPEINKFIASVIERGISFMGEVIYSYGVVNRNNPRDCIIINNCSGWFDEDYRVNNRQLTDPVVLKALAGFTDFDWDRNAMLDFFGNTEELFSDAQAFNITIGHTLSFTDANNNLAMFTLIMSTGTPDEFHKKIADKKQHLKELLTEIHVKNMALRGVTNSVVPPETVERAQIYHDGHTVTVLPLKSDDIVGSEELFAQLLERAGYHGATDKLNNGKKK